MAKRDRGIALVLCLMMLAVIIAFLIGLSTWIVGEYRVARGTKNRVLAENNALLGLDLGLAKLQKLAGPDQRITAQAGITNGVTGANQYWTGVWDATKGVRTGNAAVDYQSKENLGWLVSGTNVNPKDYTPQRLATGAARSADDVMLVGGGTIGGAAAASASIIVPKMAVFQDDGGGNSVESGHYAYWVGDEGVKARINIAPPVIDENSDSTWDRIFRQSISPREQARFSATFGSLSKWDEFSNDPKSIGSVWSADDLYQLAPENPNGYLSAAQSTFQDFGFWSTGLLANVKDGGIREDLTRVFEVPQGAFDGQQAFSDFVSNPLGEKDWARLTAAVPYNPNIPIGYLFLEKIAAASGARGAKAIRGPTWHSLRTTYRQYKREYELNKISGISNDAWNARGSYPNTFDVLASGFFTTSNSGYYMGVISSYGTAAADSVDPWVQPIVLLPGGVARFTNQPTDPGLAPVLTRVSLIFSLQRFPGQTAGTKAVNLVVDVIGAVQNPYDVPIEFDAYDISFNFNVLNGSYASPWTIQVKPKDGNAKKITIPSLFHYNYPLDNAGDENASAFVQWRFVVTYDGTKTPARRIRLAPGEVMGFSVEGNTPELFQVLPAKRGWNRMSGMRLSKLMPAGAENAGPSELLLADDKEISVSLPATLAQSSAMRITTSIPVPGHVSGLFLPGASGASRVNSRDIQEIVYAADSKSPSAAFPAVLTYFTGLDLDQKRNIAALDIQLKAADSSSPVSLGSVNNIRAPVQVPIGNGASASSRNLATSPSYQWRLIPISSVEDLNIPITSSGNGRWGSSQGASGETTIALWEIPRAPWINLASLRNADIGFSSVHQSHAVGNSFPTPYVPFDKIYHSNDTSAAASSLLGFTASDSAYLANEALWDRFYFSTIFERTDTGESENEVVEAMMPSGGDKPLPNPRIVLFDRSKTEPDQNDLLDFRKNGAELAIKGAFNVNSTSKEAWKAVLAGHAGLTPLVKSSTGTLVTESQAVNTFFPRFSIPSKSDTSVWDAGYHSLTPQQIDTLAGKIVDQVRLRGPFLSLSEFVNRRLEDSALGKEGALQAAIDAAGLNDPVTQGTTEPDQLAAYSNPDAVPSSVYTGAPNYLTQGDILAAIGPNLAARSDTFRIRAYGDSKNPRTGRVEARVWCEAIVQRTPDFVDSANGPETPVTVTGGDGLRVENPALSAINQKLGRQFRIISFRWLREDEV